MISGLAIFGGTFDPIHNAHLNIARAAADSFAIARVLFIPAAHPPHRQNGTLASYEDRLQMVQLACATDPRFEASRLEEGEAKSYSFNTIMRVKADMHPDTLYFLIGADAFAEIGSWHRWQEVVEAVTFIVVSRPGSAYAIPPGARVLRLDGLELPVSSSEIRARLTAGDSDVPVAGTVLSYILERHLYSPLYRPHSS